MNNNTLIFDLDGTLVDTANGITFAINLVLTAEGLLPLLREEVLPCIGTGGTALVQCALQKAGVIPEPSLVHHLQQKYLSAYLKEPLHDTYLYPNVHDTLSTLKAQNTYLAVCTNKAGTIALQILHELQLSPFFNTIICGDTLPQKKPHPLPVQHIIRASTRPPKNCALIGDTINDELAARNAGISFTYAAYGYGTPEALTSSPDQCILAFSELSEVYSNITL
ncbi:HAD hydrolase-like protein [Chitinophaga pendula]|uniref:HAD family hydrolase n=1 Tax=Chitinophaga TaxID=79328 RepID=UPI000BAF641B|nr:MULTISPECIES: HAD hydrolase-like protein [Chitinophaga]ASZ11823.1 hypothetical protein CK934_13065 [Chitinophaga sp. MD30]UCJ05156.1 HAD hydrolase-like protein [Chitinophaga pendula]